MSAWLGHMINILSNVEIDNFAVSSWKICWIDVHTTHSCWHRSISNMWFITFSSVAWWNIFCATILWCVLTISTTYTDCVCMKPNYLEYGNMALIRSLIRGKDAISSHHPKSLLFLFTKFDNFWMGWGVFCYPAKPFARSDMLSS